MKAMQIITPFSSKMHAKRQIIVKNFHKKQKINGNHKILLDKYKQIVYNLYVCRSNGKFKTNFDSEERLCLKH
jgi:hypothetical protein